MIGHGAWNSRGSLGNGRSELGAWKSAGYLSAKSGAWDPHEVPPTGAREVDLYGDECCRGFVCQKVVSRDVLDPGMRPAF